MNNLIGRIAKLQKLENKLDLFLEKNSDKFNKNVRKLPLIDKVRMYEEFLSIKEEGQKTLKERLDGRK